MICRLDNPAPERFVDGSARYGLDIRGQQIMIQRCLKNHSADCDQFLVRHRFHFPFVLHGRPPCDGGEDYRPLRPDLEAKV